MRASLFTFGAALGLVLAAATASASDRPQVQSTIKSAQSTNCMLECRDKGWGEDQCRAHCKWKEGG
jgi:hypothetical protein